MSTATLLIVSTRLREHVTGAGRRRLASSAPLSGRSRAAGSVDARIVQLLAMFRHGRAGTGPFLDALPGRIAWRAGSSAPNIEPRVPSGSPGSVPAAAHAIDILRFRRKSTGAIPSVSTLCGRGKRQVGAGLAIFPPYARASLLGLACFVLTAGHAFAQETPAGDTTPTISLPTVTVEAEAETRIGGPPPGPCVVVDIAGHRAGHLDCATDRLQVAADTAQAQARGAIDTPVVGAGSPDHQTGVANQTATRLRMGNAYGNSVHPQRPNRPVYSPRGGGRP